MTGPRILLLLTLLGVSGCSTTPAPSIPLGRALTAQPPPASNPPTPAGDPPTERDGTIPKHQAAEDNALAPGSTAPTPQAALARYALAYTNWQAANLPTHARQLAALAVGAARLAIEQITASQSTTTSLATDHVRNKGVVLSIAPGQGPARGRWIVVTQEQTTGTGPYAGLPPSPHVTFARTERLNGNWSVSEWSPAD
jgi:hypothetical protein